MQRMFIVLSFLVVLRNSEIIKISDGYLRGVTLRTRQGRSIRAYMGIPYAEPPIGKLRFKPPVPIQPWIGILDATQVHEKCPQIPVYTPGEYEGTEDCLFISVYTPINVQKTLPVMVYVHGGGYRTGCGNYNCYGPNVLLDRDIVLVTFNYRLGSLGFISTGDEVVPGNNGLKDQNLALQWVKTNIKEFGGDESKVTLFGQSAGGASVHLHMLSPKSQGLFHNAISESGTALTLWAFDKDENVNKTKKLAKHLKCPTENNWVMIECLKSKRAYEIIKSETTLTGWSIDPTVLFKPTLETVGIDSFMTQHPLSIIQSGNFAKVPWIVGGNTEEGGIRTAGIFSDPSLVMELDTKFNEIAPKSLGLENTYNNMHVVTKRIREFYFGEQEINYSTRLRAIDMYTDARFFSGIDEAVRLHKNHSNTNIFYYLFGYKGIGSYTEIQGAMSESSGVSHCDELFYLFPFMETFLPNKTHDQFDLKVTNIVTKLWSSFSTNSEPSVNDNFFTTWSPIKTNNLEYYFIGQNSHMSSRMLWKRLQFWRKLNKQFRKPLFTST